MARIVTQWNPISQAKDSQSSARAGKANTASSESSSLGLHASIRVICPHNSAAAGVHQHQSQGKESHVALQYSIEKPTDIGPTLEAAFASGRTSLVNVMTDPTTVSPGSIALANVGAYR